MIISYEIFWSENPLRTLENDDNQMIYDILKSLILINFIKKNRLAAGALPGVILGGGHGFGGPLRGS